MLQKNLVKRSNFIFAVFTLCFIGFIALLVYCQAINPEKYISGSAISVYSVSVTAPRGEILDINGNPLVYNEQINTITVNALDFPRENKEKNKVIIELINYLEAKEEKWTDALPLVFDESGQIAFKENAESSVAWLKSEDMCAVNPYATARDCFDVLIEKYELEEYSEIQARKIASVRYNMDKLYFSASIPYTFAEKISITTIAYIKENSHIFTGVDAGITSERKYAGNGRTASHILGVIGAISAEEYSFYKEQTQTLIAEAGNNEELIRQIQNKSYSLTDKTGKNGIEGAFEEYLRGYKGTKKISVNASKEISESYSDIPGAGNSVFLTINQNLQEIASKSLKNQIMAVTSEEAIANGLHPAGAVVVQDVRTGAVLASASYPDFSLNTYYEDYSSLANDPGKPLWNRTLQSTYSPGSTMKPVIAIAALEEGIIEPDSICYCEGTYEYIDQVFACFGKTAHGAINVKQALQHSCNIFFFEMARQLGIEKMNTYASLFGLGEATGIEIGESEGILAGIAYRESLGMGWKAGETLLAAIGQSDNSFTPLQLTNYCATIANGGTRYTPYLVEKIVDSGFSTVIYQHQPVVAAQTNISQETLDTVKEGMWLVANRGSCEPYLGDLQYEVACKTGTAEKTLVVDGRIVEGTNGFLIAFGPYENSEIAVTVVIENAGSGSSTAAVAADIFEYYFSTIDSAVNVQQDNTVIW